MGSVAGAVVGGIVSSKKQSSARRKAAREQSRAQLESAQLLEEAGRKAEADILRANAQAAETAALAATEAEADISPFADIEQFQQVQDEIISNLPISGAIADSIRNASSQFVLDRPEIFNISGPVANEVQRQADLSVSAATPDFRQNQLTSAQQGLAAATDVAQIRQRGLERLGDIAGGQAAQRASVLVGQAPQLAQLATGAQEARLLEDVAGQQFVTSTANTLANLAGQAFGIPGRPAQAGQAGIPGGR